MWHPLAEAAAAAAPAPQFNWGTTWDVLQFGLTLVVMLISGYAARQTSRIDKLEDRNEQQTERLVSSHLAEVNRRLGTCEDSIRQLLERDQRLEVQILRDLGALRELVNDKFERFEERWREEQQRGGGRRGA